jgi:DNA-binding beta-propeller fold protein YncE
MKKTTRQIRRMIVSSLIVLGLAFGATAQTVETLNGVRTVHNRKGGEWGKNPRIGLDLVRMIGDVDTADENLAFNSPRDIVLDAAGSMYILDSGNQRIQKFGPEGKYLATIGRKGQGPGEFAFPMSLDIDAKGFLFVLDNDQKRIQVFAPESGYSRNIPTTKLSLERLLSLKRGSFLAARRATFGLPGEPKDKKAPKLLEILDPGMNIIREFGEPLDYGDAMTNTVGNSFRFTADGDDNVLLAFVYQNRIEKYSPDGQLLWRADRELNYPTGVLKKGKTESEGNKTISYTAPKMNRVVSGIGEDGKGRVWVVTQNRQIKKEEEVMIMVTGTVSGGETRKITGNTDLRTTDMFELEVFDADGILLGEIPVTQFVDALWVWKDRLFLLDRDRGVKYYEYLIIEKRVKS